jgi:Cu2+-exporting ATPase
MNADISSDVAIGPMAKGRAGFVPEDPAAARAPVAVPEGRPDFDFDSLTVREVDGTRSLTLLIENLHCAGCIAAVERSLSHLPGVIEARVNLSTRRACIRWHAGAIEPERFIATLDEIGYPARPFDAAVADRAGAVEERELLRCLAVAGFAAANVMLLSVSVWSGAASDMSEVTRDLFHWVSALIALPAIVYAGRPFFRSAESALSARRLNMDVPIALAVTLAAAMSLVETVRGGEHAYFDAAVTLLFFLLIGRYLDRLTRDRARNAAERLLSFNRSHATVLGPDGRARELPIAAVAPGMIVRSLPGERIPIDGRILDGNADIDTSILTGESVPIAAGPETLVYAGTLNINGALAIRVVAAGDKTLLAEIVRLVELAEQGRARFTRIADRVARIYSPVVHALALATFLGWWLGAGSAVWPALTAAIAVLIITCPCALGLAVPAVQVAAVGRLLRHGVLVKSADALERLAIVDTVVFDKTGTLTEGRPELDGVLPADRLELAGAAVLASHSRHPMAQAFAVAMADTAAHDVSEVIEVPGAGISGIVDGTGIRIGNRKFCDANDTGPGAQDGASELWVKIAASPPLRLCFRDRLRPDAAAAVAALRASGMRVSLLSGDRPGAVSFVAAACGIDDWRAECLPADKVRLLEAAKAAGRRVLMVGDGINDAPAIAAATVGMSPGSGATVSQVASDLVFLGSRLQSVGEACQLARGADRLVRQNFVLAVGYNAIAVPIAMAGLATPLVAAVAMSCSSIIVTLNAMRLSFRRRAQ